MDGKPWMLGDFQFQYYKCTSGIKKDIVLRRVPAPKYVVWRMILSEDQRHVLVEFRCRGCKQTTDQHACTAFFEYCACGLSPSYIMTGFQVLSATRAWYNRVCACKK